MSVKIGSYQIVKYNLMSDKCPPDGMVEGLRRGHVT